jgi:signal transduction histidine kinase
MVPWLVPALVAAGQFALWPGVLLVRGDTVDPVRAVAVAAVVAVTTVALSWRRRVPVVATAAVAAGITLGQVVVPGQEFLAPGDALLVLSAADLIALFSVSVRCSRRTTLLVVAGLTLWQAGLPALGAGFTGDYPFDLLLTVGVYVLVAAGGRVRRRWTGDRAEAARRLAEAEEARREAAAAERRRLARELHDVTAHHLTSIVVNASAAQFLGDQRPELRAEALDFAARTGRDTLTDLRRLVAILPFGEERPAAPVPSPADLADDFRQLGQRVMVEVAGDPPPEVAAALHAIAREALTNTLRYAPGGTVRLSQTYGPDGAELVVEDDGGVSAPDTRLGGGRGVTGMRERAEALGGTLRAGPRSPHGWRVHAVLPAVSVSAPRRLSRWMRGERVLDAGLAVLTLVMPLAGFAVVAEEDGLAPAPATLILLALIAHSLPLLWRWRHPWWVLAAVTSTVWLGPLLVATHVVPAGGSWLFLFSLGADLAAVYAVAARGARPALTWLAPVASTASAAFAISVLAALAPPAPGDPVIEGPAMVGFLVAVFVVVAGVVLALPMGACWLAGHTARRRRQRRADREEGAVAVAAAQAEWHTRDERARVAAGLRDAVLDRAARVPRAAEEADLPAVLDSARETLSAMRALLDGLDSRPTSAGIADREVPSSQSV